MPMHANVSTEFVIQFYRPAFFKMAAIFTVHSDPMLLIFVCLKFSPSLEKFDEISSEFDGKKYETMNDTILTNVLLSCSSHLSFLKFEHKIIFYDT